MYPGLLLNSYDGDTTADETNLRSEALELYAYMLTRGKLHRTLSFLQHKSRRLLDIEFSIPPNCIHNKHYAGQQIVSIDQIQGSEGREGDFDDAFYPLHERLRSRWLGVASARLSGRGLPPVELINVGEVYFVRDGHHRISVAKALGEKYIDAEVIDLDC